MAVAEATASWVAGRFEQSIVPTLIECIEHLQTARKLTPCVAEVLAAH